MLVLKIRFTDHLIAETVTNTAVHGQVLGFNISTRLGYYRGLPLSAIQNFALKVDGEPVDPRNVAFRLNNKRFLIGQLAELYSEYWYLLDEAVLEVLQTGGLAAGEHTVDLLLEFRSPYLPMPGEHQYATIDSSDSRTVRVQG